MMSLYINRDKTHASGKHRKQRKYTWRDETENGDSFEHLSLPAHNAFSPTVFIAMCKKCVEDNSSVYWKNLKMKLKKNQLFSNAEKKKGGEGWSEFVLYSAEDRHAFLFSALFFLN